MRDGGRCSPSAALERVAFRPPGCYLRWPCLVIRSTIRTRVAAPRSKESRDMNSQAVNAQTISTPPTAVRAHRVARGAALGVVVAWIATTIVYVIGNAGANVRVVTGWAPNGIDLRYIDVLVTVAASVGLGAMLLWVTERRSTHAFRAWAIVAIGVAVLSAVPLWQLDVDTGSKTALTLMHLATGVAAVGAQALLHRAPSR